MNIKKPELKMYNFELLRTMWLVAVVTLAGLVTIHWIIETPWVVYHVCVILVALCLGLLVISTPDSVHVKRGWREHSVQTVPTITTTRVQPFTVRHV